MISMDYIMWPRKLPSVGKTWDRIKLPQNCPNKHSVLMVMWLNLILGHLLNICHCHVCMLYLHSDIRSKVQCHSATHPPWDWGLMSPLVTLLYIWFHKSLQSSLMSFYLKVYSGSISRLYGHKWHFNQSSQDITGLYPKLSQLILLQYQYIPGGGCTVG